MSSPTRSLRGRFQKRCKGSQSGSRSGSQGTFLQFRPLKMRTKNMSIVSGLSRASGSRDIKHSRAPNRSWEAMSERPLRQKPPVHPSVVLQALRSLGGFAGSSFLPKVTFLVNYTARSRRSLSKPRLAVVETRRSREPCTSPRFRAVSKDLTNLQSAATL